MICDYCKGESEDNGHTIYPYRGVTQTYMARKNKIDL